MPGLTCSLCPYGLTAHLNFNITDLLRHIQLFHSHQPSFAITCGLGGCLRNFRNFTVFRNHVYAFHRNSSNLSSTNTSGEDNEGQSSGEGEHDDAAEGSFDGLSISLEDLQVSSALFLLGVKEKYKLTQVALQGIIEGVTGLIQARLSALHSRIHKKLLGYVPSSVTDDVDDLFAEDGPFCRPFVGLETQHQQMSFYHAHFNFIEPIRVTLGEQRVWKGSGSKRRSVVKEDEMMYIPVLETIQNILRKDAVMEEVVNGHQHDHNLGDFCDGEVYRSHPLFTLHSTALQIFFYFDDLEVCNPLGSKAKIHKISIFYFLLGNIPPKFRSQLSSINLVAITKQRNLSRYGMESILHPFIEDLKKLEGGYTFVVDSVPRLFYGTLCAISGDNLGSLALGGFKESCSSYRCCRHCMATQVTAKTKFTEAQFVLRDPTSHDFQCSLLATDDEASREYGINRNSNLNTLRYFHVCDGGLLPDIMHDLLEGVLQYEVKLMLTVMIRVEQYFSLTQFNSRLVNTELGYMEIKDKPTPITITTLSSPGHSLKQAAAQMWLLGRILPLVVGDLVPEDDERWENFLLLMEIVDLLFSPRISEDNAVYLAALISDHHEQFVKLYPDNSVIPKMHFMVHMPRLILQFGPLVQHWTMRYEAKHAYFKTLAQSIGNFINISYTLAMRHQLYSCYQTASSSGTRVSRLIVGPGSVVPPSILEDTLECDISTLFEAKWVEVNGIKFKKNAAIVASINDDLPQIAKILKIYVINAATVIFGTKCFSVSYNSHFRAYSLLPLPSDDTSFFYHKDLPLHLPLTIRSSRVLPAKCIIMPYNIFDLV